MAQKIIADRDVLIATLEQIRASIPPGRGLAMEEFEHFVARCAELHQYIVACPPHTTNAAYPRMRVGRG